MGVRSEGNSGLLSDTGEETSSSLVTVSDSGGNSSGLIGGGGILRVGRLGLGEEVLCSEPDDEEAMGVQSRDMMQGAMM